MISIVHHFIVLIHFRYYDLYLENMVFVADYFSLISVISVSNSIIKCMLWWKSKMMKSAWAKQVTIHTLLMDTILNPTNVLDRPDSRVISVADSEITTRLSSPMFSDHCWFILEAYTRDRSFLSLLLAKKHSCSKFSCIYTRFIPNRTFWDAIVGRIRRGNPQMLAQLEAFDWRRKCYSPAEDSDSNQFDE